MIFGVPTGAVAHIGIALVAAYLIKVNLAVTVVCAVLPDLIDKPLTAALGIVEGRYVAHTLLFVIAVALAFALWKRQYGLAALVGGLSHLLLDIGNNLPIFYPFVSYEFHKGQADFWNYIRYYFTWQVMGMEVLFVALAALAAFLFMQLYRRLRG